MRRTRIYVAGPYSTGNPEENSLRAITTATTLLDAGFAPYVPHLTHWWHLRHPRPYETWMGLDFEFLQVCDIVLRLPGVSDGADREVAMAMAQKIPVYLSLDTLFACEKPTRR